MAPKKFSLGARRPGWDLPMNAGACTMLVDGEAVFILDRVTGERRLGLMSDWLEATRLIDAVDEVGLYWAMLEATDRDESMAGYVGYLRDLFSNFSKHVQDGTSTPEQSAWLAEVLQVVFGDKETVRRKHPLSFLVCPQTPLIIEGPHTEAYLALVEYDVPLAAMPMPLMGATAPGSLISTIVVGNCEVLAMLCLQQAASPGTPFIYAPALAVINPRSGNYSAGAIEHSLLGAAATEMARYYGLPVEASGMGTDHYLPGIQPAYERTAGGLLPALSWPDILVGPGLLGGSMILCLEQLLIDVEVFRMFKRLRRGIDTREHQWLEDILDAQGPGGSFLAERSTVQSLRSGEWHVPQIGWHDTYEAWEARGHPLLLEQVELKVDKILATHEPLPLEEDIDRELASIQQRAGEGR
jgi:trimethylamine--corrinoid protein Co-methyltransferase